MSKEIIPDQLLQEALYIIQLDLKSLKLKAETESLEAEDARVVCSYAKCLTDLNRELRMSLKDIDPDKMSESEIEAELEKYETIKSKKVKNVKVSSPD